MVCWYVYIRNAIVLVKKVKNSLNCEETFLILSWLPKRKNGGKRILNRKYIYTKIISTLFFNLFSLKTK